MACLGRGDTSEISTYIQKAVDNDFSGNMIDVCPVGALTDNTFRFKSRVWFTKPLDAHRACDKCCGKVVLLYERRRRAASLSTERSIWRGKGIHLQ